jgi:MFS family permease
LLLFPVPLLFIGRALQAICGTILWVVGFATLADTVGQDSMGKTVGLGAGVISAGVFTGPMLAGWLNEMVGYWPAWLSALAMVRIFKLCPALSINY